ncbi:MAG: hypothetical protein ACK2T7_02330 [Anaerolineales bacterium]
MKNKSKKYNWIVDAVLFVGFMIAFWLDLTGLAWHQWLGVLVGVLSAYHLLIHWKWVEAVTRRLLARGSRQAKIYYWLDLTLPNYVLWLDVHIQSSIATLVLLVLKIGLHWRWVESVFQRSILVPRIQLVIQQTTRASKAEIQVG